MRTLACFFVLGETSVLRTARSSPLSDRRCPAHNAVSVLCLARRKTRVKAVVDVRGRAMALAAEHDGLGESTGSGSSEESWNEEACARTLEILRKDLPEQYARSVDLSIYAKDVRFDDPVTKLRGKLRYRGMLTILRVLVGVVATGGTAEFALDSIELVRARCAIVTTWRTAARVRFGRRGWVRISGTDVFHLDGATGLVLRHESQWAEAPGAVGRQCREAFF